MYSLYILNNNVYNVLSKPLKYHDLLHLHKLRDDSFYICYIGGCILGQTFLDPIDLIWLLNCDLFFVPSAIPPSFYLLQYVKDYILWRPNAQ